MSNNPKKSQVTRTEAEKGGGGGPESVASRSVWGSFLHLSETLTPAPHNTAIMSGALFGGNLRSSSKNLVEFKVRRRCCGEREERR